MELLKSPNAALILALVYFVFPLDLVPDIFGPLGRLDDLLIFGLALWRVMKDRQQRAEERSAPKTEESAPKARTPHEIFNLKPGASRAEIDARFRELAKDYHPDRVAHLGEELRTVAHEKMIEIQKAYDQLSKQVPG